MHRQHHPEPVAGCFGCKVLDVSYQGLKSQAGGRRSDPVERVPVIADSGVRAGRIVGHHAVHWSGAQDAVVRPTTHVRKTTSEEKE